MAKSGIAVHFTQFWWLVYHNFWTETFHKIV